MLHRRLNRSIKELKSKDNHNEDYKSKKTAFTRNRKMGFIDYVWYLIMQKGRTTSVELDEYLKSKNDTYEISISKQAFSKQRQYLKPEIFIDTNRKYMQDFYENYPEEVQTYKGHYIFAVDGTLLEIPNTKELQEEYRTNFNGQPNRDAARARVSGIYDVENGFMIDALIRGCNEGEEKLAQENIENAEKIVDLKKV